MICIQDLDVNTYDDQEAAEGFQAGFAEILDKVAKDVRAGKYGQGCHLDVVKVFASIHERMSIRGYPVFEARPAKPH